MSYRIRWSGPAQRDLARLPSRVATAVLVFIDERLAANLKPMIGDMAGKRTARNGDYRVLLRVDDEADTLWILNVDHRAHVYRPR